MPWNVCRKDLTSVICTVSAWLRLSPPDLMIVKIPRFVRCNRIAGCRKYGTIELQMTLSAVLNLTAHDIRYLCICASVLCIFMSILSLLTVSWLIPFRQEGVDDGRSTARRRPSRGGAEKKVRAKKNHWRICLLLIDKKRRSIAAISSPVLELLSVPSLIH